MLKSSILVRFDKDGMPFIKAKNCTRSQFADAGLFLGGASRERYYRKKNTNKLVRFIRRLLGISKPTKNKIHRKIYVALPLIK